MKGTVKYLLAQEADYRWGVVTHTVGLQEAPAGTTYPPGNHPQGHQFSTDKGRVLHNVHILYILKGRGWFSSTHCPHTYVKAGDAIILFPGEWHNYAPLAEVGWEEAWIGFSGDFADRIINERFFTVDNPIHHIGVCDTLCNAFENAYTVARDEHPAYQQQLAGYVNLIVSEIYARSKQEPYRGSEDAAKITLAKKYMRKCIANNLNMEEVAAHVGMGYSKFRKTFKNQTGFPPIQYFLKLKLERAKDYLLSTDLSIKEIAFRLGFDSAAYFNKVFRQHQQQTPLEFRRMASVQAPLTLEE